MYLHSPARVEELWGHLAPKLTAAGIDAVPSNLSWPVDYFQHWLEPELLLSQACGFPLIDKLAGKVRLLGTFGYDVDGCDGLFCRSKLIARANDPAAKLVDFRGRCVAYNGTHSQSGYNALRALVAPLAVAGKFFGQRIETGSHAKSIELVRDGVADIACVDCVSFAAIERYSPELTQGVRVIGYSDPYPGLPLITSVHTSNTTVAVLYAALMDVMQDPALSTVRKALFIQDFVPTEVSAYRICAQMRDRAIALGCDAL